MSLARIIKARASLGMSVRALLSLSASLCLLCLSIYVLYMPPFSFVFNLFLSIHYCCFFGSFFFLNSASAALQIPGWSTERHWFDLQFYLCLVVWNAPFVIQSGGHLLPPPASPLNEPYWLVLHINGGFRPGAGQHSHFSPNGWINSLSDKGQLINKSLI